MFHTRHISNGDITDTEGQPNKKRFCDCTANRQPAATKKNSIVEDLDWQVDMITSRKKLNEYQRGARYLYRSF